MDFKKYYLRNELVWNELTEEQVFALHEKHVVDIDGKQVGFAPRVALFKTDDGFVEMFEVSNTNVFLNWILNGVTSPSGEIGNAVAMPTVTMPLNVVYAVRAVISQSNYYYNNRFFPNIEDAIDYYNKIRAFIIQKNEDQPRQKNEDQPRVENTEIPAEQ